MDQMFGLSENTAADYFPQFCTHICDLYGQQFLKRRTAVAELKDMVKTYTEIGFPWAAGCIDCMRLECKSCPLTDKGKYNNPEALRLATVLWGVGDHDLNSWHWFSGRPGTNNSINVLISLPLLREIVDGIFRFYIEERYNVSPHWTSRTFLYLLGDGIHLSSLIFSKPIRQAETYDERNHSGRQETVRKDVELLFAVIQSII